MSSSKLKPSFGGRGGALVGFGGLSRNPFGLVIKLCLIMSSLTFFRGTGLGFTFSHFPVLGGGVGLMLCATSSLKGSSLNRLP